MPSDSDSSAVLQTNILGWRPEQHSPGQVSHITGIGHVTVNAIFIKMRAEPTDLGTISTFRAEDKEGKPMWRQKKLIGR